jgi:predicted house-cleaning NTP pyrophosphatase (Maf/HAM1 superfamily)
MARHGVECGVEVADIDEKAIRLADPKAMTVAIARAKAEALKPRLAVPCILITADQVRQENAGVVPFKCRSVADAS